MNQRWINRRNKSFGKKVEQAVAKYLGGERTPGSGAFKRSNRNLTGDVEVDDNLGYPFLKVECKGVSTRDSGGEEVYTLRRRVLDQAVAEADASREIGAVWVHWHLGQYAHDHVILHHRHLDRLINLAVAGSIDQQSVPSLVFAGQVQPGGEKSCTLRRLDLDVMLYQRQAARGLGYISIQWGDDQFYLIKSSDFKFLVDKAKIGSVIERRGGL